MRSKPWGPKIGSKKREFSMGAQNGGHHHEQKGKRGGILRIENLKSVISQPGRPQRGLADFSQPGRDGYPRPRIPWTPGLAA